MEEKAIKEIFLQALELFRVRYFRLYTEDGQRPTNEAVINLIKQTNQKFSKDTNNMALNDEYRKQMEDEMTWFECSINAREPTLQLNKKIAQLIYE
jgi:hypothetical protein